MKKAELIEEIKLMTETLNNEKSNVKTVDLSGISKMTLVQLKKVYEYTKNIYDDNIKFFPLQNDELPNAPKKPKQEKFVWAEKNGLKPEKLDNLLFENIVVGDIIAFRLDYKSLRKKPNLMYTETIKDFPTDENDMLWFKVTAINGDEVELTNPNDGIKWYLYADNFNGRKSLNDKKLAFTKYVKIPVKKVANQKTA